METLVGKELKDRYRIESSIGRGGMAEVYQAYDEKRAGRVAIKILREDLARDKVFIRRFEREAKTLSKLQHRNIVRFYGLERDGLNVFIVMDFIEGRALRDLIFSAEKPLPLEEVMGFMEPVCAALHYAHEMGIVHCDIKPANIMLAKNGDVMVSDFGIARSMDAATATMVGVGTPAYMAPELIKGKDPTPQSDIYSLGITMYEMLTGGERPFTGERAGITGTTAEKVRWQHLHGKVTSPRKYNKQLSKHVEVVLLKCLEKDPKERFRTVQELLYALTHDTMFPESEMDQDEASSAEGKIENAAGEAEPDSAHDLNERSWISKAQERIQKEWNAMTKQAKIIVIAVGGLLLISNIVLGILAFGNRQNGTAVVEAAAIEETPIPTSTAVPTNTPTPQPLCVVEDRDYIVAGWEENCCADFSIDSDVDGWKVDGDINERVANVNLENYKDQLNVRAELFQELTTYIGSPAPDLRDFMVSVEGRLSSYSGHPYHEWGIALKAQGNTYYYFSIDSKNNYYFNLVRDGKKSAILDGRFSNDILPIDEFNRLTVVVDNYEFQLLINGVLQTSVKDNRLLSGDSGIYLSMGENTTLDWEFDDFVVYAP